MPVSTARDSRGVSRLTAQQNLAQLRLGDHACLFYRNGHDELAMTAAFFAIGLRRRERCLCVFDQPRIGRLRTALRAAGVAIDAAERDGRFIIKTDDAYLVDGQFDPEQMVRMLGQEVERALDDRFRGLRAAGEMKWALGRTVDLNSFIAYEAMMNQFYPRNAAVGLCLYSLRAFPPDLLERVLRAHPAAVHNGHLCMNKFFEPPHVTLSGKPGARAGWMLDELRPGTRGDRPLKASLTGRTARAAR